MKVNNIEAHAKGKRYLVVNIVDGEAWFYDAWNDYSGAAEQAYEIGGLIVPAEEVET